MEGIAVLFFILSLLGLLFVGPLYFSNLKRFLSCLRDGHLQEWERLGGPILAPFDKSANSPKLFSYLMNRRYLAADDVELAETGNSARAFLIGSLILLGIAFVSIFLMMVVH